MRVALVTSLLTCALLVPGTTDAAGAVLPAVAKPDAAFVDMRVAVSVTPAGSTRWSEITVPSNTPAMWLVPVRPGAAIDWAPARWLDALDEATAPRILPPAYVFPTCPVRGSPETPRPWTTPGPKQPPAALAVHSTADSARAYVAERGYRLDTAIASRISELYSKGWNLVALEMAASSSEKTSSTLRVSDDGGAVLPFALTGGSSTRVTVFAIGAGVAAVPGIRDVDRSALRWGREGSTFTTWRRSEIDGGQGRTWLRESASHEALFDGTQLTHADTIASVVDRYLQGMSCSPSVAKDLSLEPGVVGTTCAPGTAARAPGGGACVAASGAIDPAALSCAADIDLALALSGLSPARAIVTRLVGRIPGGALGADLAVGFDQAANRQSPAIRATAYESCRSSPSGGFPEPEQDSPPPLHPQPSGGNRSSTSSEGDVYVGTSSGCSGGAVGSSTTTYEEEPVPEDTSDDGSSTESCSGGGSSSGWDSSDDSDGWDDGDSGESCSSDDSSSSSSDSCSGGGDGWDTSDSDDGWDTSDMNPRGKKVRPAAKKTSKKKSSPVSRYALLAAALLLPLRRRKRAEERE